MKFDNFAVLVIALCAYLSGYVLGLWHTVSLAHIADQTTSVITAVSIMTVVVIVQNSLNKDAILKYVHQHASAVHNATIADLHESHRKRIIVLKNNHNQDMREARGHIAHLRARINGINNDHDYMCTMYRDQKRCNEEQEERIDYLEKKLKEFGQLSVTAAMPHSAPASQTTFANTPSRVRSTVKLSSPLSQTPMVQVEEAAWE